jgi:hypothetical protein
LLSTVIIRQNRALELTIFYQNLNIFCAGLRPAHDGTGTLPVGFQEAAWRESDDFGHAEQQAIPARN